MQENKKIMIQELNRIADLLCERETLYQRLSEENERSEEELNGMKTEVAQKMHAYQTQRSEVLEQICPDMTALTLPLPEQIKATTGIFDEDGKASDYATAITKCGVDIQKGECLADKLKQIGKAAIFHSRNKAIGFLLIVVSFVMGRFEFLTELIGFVALVGIIVFFVSRSKARPLRAVYLGGIRAIQERKEKSDRYKKDCEAREARLTEIAAEFETKDCEKAVAVLVETMEAYDKEFHAMVADCDKTFHSAFSEYVGHYQKACAAHEEIAAKINRSIEANQAQLSAVTLLNPDMFDRARQIAEAIRMGRADTVKEAINIVLDDERRAEEEAQRRREAAARQAALEQQAADNRRHNEEMERAAARQAVEAKRHNEEMERSANARAEADKQERIRMAQNGAEIARTLWSVLLAIGRKVRELFARVLFPAKDSFGANIAPHAIWKRIYS